MGSSTSRLKSTPSNCNRSRFHRSSLSSLFCASSLPLEPGEHLVESLSPSSQNLTANRSNSVQLSSWTSGLETESEAGTFAASSSNPDTSFSSNPYGGILQETHVSGTSLKYSPADAPGSSQENQEDVNPHSHGETIRDTASNGNTARSDSPVTSETLPGLILTVGEQGLIGMGVLLVDVVNVNPNTLSSSIAEVSNREARRNSRRMYFNALSRIRSSRDSDSPTPTVVNTTSRSDDIRSHDRWLLDYDSDLHYDGIGHESRYSSRRSDRWRGQRWQSRYEMSERFHDVHDEHERESFRCLMGLHPRGSCSCNSSTAEEPNSLTAISPFILVADAIFEVIEEIRRHGMSLSLSMPTLPAPEAVVDSFPLKNHAKLCGTSDTLQCHICLVDYEEGDKIRVLPCSHEYHKSCVDKWLKEIHGVCPLCRDDVSKGRVEGSTSYL